MSVKKRGKVYYLRIRPFDGKLINVKTMAQSKAGSFKNRTFRTNGSWDLEIIGLLIRQVGKCAYASSRIKAGKCLWTCVMSRESEKS